MKLQLQIFKFQDDFEKFRDSKEYKFYVFLKENRTILSILQENYRDLMKEVDNHNNPRYDDIHWHETSKLRWHLQRKVIRVLSNYLSSICWVVDFSRNNSRKYLEPNPNYLTEFDKTIENNFTTDPTHRFIQDLRNYINHKAFIKITTIKKATALGIERNIFISKKQLLSTSYSWKREAKNFIHLQNEEIYLIDILRQHYNKFLDFQNSIYLSIVRSDSELTTSLISALEDCYTQAKALNLAYILPFDRAYIRYLKYLHSYSAQHGVLCKLG